VPEKTISGHLLVCAGVVYHSRVLDNYCHWMDAGVTLTVIMSAIHWKPKLASLLQFSKQDVQWDVTPDLVPAGVHICTQVMQSGCARKLCNQGNYC